MRMHRLACSPPGKMGICLRTLFSRIRRLSSLPPPSLLVQPFRPQIYVQAPNRIHSRTMSVFHCLRQPLRHSNTVMHIGLASYEHSNLSRLINHRPLRSNSAFGICNYPLIWAFVVRGVEDLVGELRIPICKMFAHLVLWCRKVADANIGGRHEGSGLAMGFGIRDDVDCEGWVIVRA